MKVLYANFFSLFSSLLIERRHRISIHSEVAGSDYRKERFASRTATTRMASIPYNLLYQLNSVTLGQWGLEERVRAGGYERVRAMTGQCQVSWADTGDKICR